MKWLLWAVTSLILILAAIIAAIWFYPQLLVSSINSNTDFKLKAEHVELSYFPPTLEFKSLEVSSQEQAFAEFGELKVTSSWGKLREQKSPFAMLKVNNAVIDLNKLPQTPEQKLTSKQSSQLNLYELSNSVRINADNVIIKIDEPSSVTVHQLNNGLESLSNSQSQLKVNFSASYKNKESSLTIDGFALLNNQAAGNRIAVQLEQVDLINFLATKDSEPNTGKIPKAAADEAEIDWSWMNNFSDTKLDLQIGQLLWPQGSVQNLATQIELSNEIKLKASGDLELAFENQTNFTDFVSIETTFTPLSKRTNGADVVGTITLQSNDASVSAEGQFNLNGIESNSTDFDLNIASLPKAIDIDSKLLKPYLPLALSGQLATQEDQFDIEQIVASLGESDLGGKVGVKLASNEQTELTFELTSKQFYYQTQQNDEQLEQKPEQASAKITESLFSSDAIDWSWMSTVKAQGLLQVDSLIYGKSEFNKVSLPLELNEQGLKIDKLKSEINSGTITIALQLRPNEEGVKIDTSADFNNVDMSKSKLFEEGAITGGLIDGNFIITSSGQSTSELAANSNGTLLANIGAGKIAQGSMDILGSDLILSTLSKLNPFSKSDASTTLKCAVVNLKIEDGVVRAKNSLAMETSKVAIIGTGKINLNDEKLDLKFNPKAKKSLGVSLSSLAKAVKLGGSLAKPKAIISALGIAETGLSVGAAVSTGGLSLLAEGLADGVTADQACVNAKRAFDAKSQEPTSTPSEQTTVEQETPEIELQEIELQH